jgi:hypothetical protein
LQRGIVILPHSVWKYYDDRLFVAGVAPAIRSWHEALPIPTDQIWHNGRIPIPDMPRDAVD